MTEIAALLGMIIIVLWYIWKKLDGIERQLKSQTHLMSGGYPKSGGWGEAAQ